MFFRIYTILLNRYPQIDILTPPLQIYRVRAQLQQTLPAVPKVLLVGVPARHHGGLGKTTGVRQRVGQRGRFSLSQAFATQEPSPLSPLSRFPIVSFSHCLVLSHPRCLITCLLRTSNLELRTSIMPSGLPNKGHPARPGHWLLGCWSRLLSFPRFQILGGSRQSPGQPPVFRGSHPRPVLYSL